ncbi:hypothetical protein [Lacimicrobium alkaliphilum]|uniref:Uncharacterized protein n=1 Tax=Lacimicrobium alkaliphilum TaxID=1526571 RepID=A0ABQ1RB20_9ALTE|nr:hypothetical protein [Lacimicrobium alkaliphilum]GGD64457.1 hypothetical protein GCM10011357_19750 [Lacimicrobium alkaliphilum]
MEKIRHAQWITLHRQYEHYEYLALVIKLAGVMTALTGLFSAMDCWPVLLILAVLWLLEGIWKTFQARLEVSLMALENTQAETTLFPVYNNWQQNRPGLVTLVGQYLRASLRPTVAFPYIVLMLIILLPLIY